MSYDLGELPKLLNDLYDVVSRLEAIAPGRKFTPDGHLVGSIGETVAAYAYGLELLPASVKQHDARTRDGRCVQIKLTQGTSVALSYDCEHLLVLQLSRSTGFIEVYNGPGAPVWQEIESKAAVGRQRQITLSRLRTFPPIAARDQPYPSIPSPAAAAHSRHRHDKRIRPGDHGGEGYLLTMPRPATVPISRTKWAILFSEQGGCCAGCFKRLDDDVHVDHVMPLARGGYDVFENLQLLHARCNLVKGDMGPAAWFARQKRWLLAETAQIRRRQMLVTLDPALVTRAAGHGEEGTPAGVGNHRRRRTAIARRTLV